MPWWFSAFTNPGQRPTAWRHRRPVPWTKTGSLPHRAGPWVYPDGDTVGPWRFGRRLRQCVPCCWCIQTDKLPTPFLSRRLSRFPPRRAFGFGFGFGLGFDFGFGLDWIRRRLGFRCRFDTILLCFVKLRGKIFQLLTRRPVPWTKTGSLPHRAGPGIFPGGCGRPDICSIGGRHSRVLPPPGR